MQLVTPSVVPTAVSTAIITCKIVFQTSFFIFFFLPVSFLFTIGFGSLDHDCTFNTFFLQFTSDIICSADITAEIIRICCTSAAAVEPGKTFSAFFFCIDVAALKFITDLCIFNPIIHIAEQELLIAYKLMARIKITPRRYRKVLGSRTTAGQTFCHTRTTFKIDHKMEEIKIISLFVTSYHLCSKLVIFLKQLWKIFLCDRIRFTRFCNYWLHGDLFETKIGKMKYICCKIRIVVCECTTHIIFVLMSALCKFLELWNDQIITSCPFAERTHLIMNFLSSIDT